MEPRQPRGMKNPAMILKDATPLLVGLGKTLASSPIPAKTFGLVHLRTSQINGCAVCIDMEIGKTTETPQRLVRRRGVAGCSSFSPTPNVRPWHWPRP